MGILIFIFILIVGFLFFAMNSKAQIFQSGFFKKLRSLFSSAKRVQKVILFSETGIISLEQYAMDVAYISNMVEKFTWLVIHKLKSRVKETGDIVLCITEKNYIPSDPYGRVTDEDIQPLDEIALHKYDEKCVRISEKAIKDIRTSVYQMIVTGCICIIVVILVFSFIKK
jgi:hypothetical protein